MLRRSLTVAVLLAASVAVTNGVRAESVPLPAPATVGDADDSIAVRCQSPDTSRPVRSNRPSEGFSLTRSVKSAFSKAGDALKPEKKVAPQYDPTRLATKVGPIGPEVYVAAGRLAERRGNVENAVAQYEKALEVDSRDRTALITYARLQQRRGLFTEAEKLYRRAIQVRPDDAVAYNDLGLCLDNRGQTVPAIEMLKTAVALTPDRALYRNNLALVLTKAGRPNQAYPHLVHAHGEAVAHYNLGYLLLRDNKPDAAVAHLARSLEIDPTLQSAHDMLAQMGYTRASSETRPSAKPGVHVVGQSGRRRSPPPVYDAAPRQPVQTPQAAPAESIAGPVVPPAGSLVDPAWHLLPRNLREPMQSPPSRPHIQSPQPTAPATGPELGIRLPQSSDRPQPVEPDGGPHRIPAPEPVDLGYDANQMQRTGRFGYTGRPQADVPAQETAVDRGPVPELAPPRSVPSLEPPEVGRRVVPEERVDLQGNEERHFNVARYPTVRIPSRRTPPPSRPASAAPVPGKIEPFRSDLETPQFLPPVR